MEERFSIKSFKFFQTMASFSRENLPRLCISYLSRLRERWHCAVSVRFSVFLQSSFGEWLARRAGGAVAAKEFSQPAPLRTPSDKSLESPNQFSVVHIPGR